MPLGGGPDGTQHELGGPRGRMSCSWPPEPSIPGVTALPVDYIYWNKSLLQMFLSIFTKPSQVYFQMQRSFLYNLCINITKCNWGCLEIPSIWWENGISSEREFSVRSQCVQDSKQWRSMEGAMSLQNHWRETQRTPVRVFSVALVMLKG